MNIVEKHSKLVYSILCTNQITAEGSAKLILEGAWQYEGLPDKSSLTMVLNLQLSSLKS